MRSPRGPGRRDAARRAVVVPGGQVVAAHRRRVQAGAGDRRDRARVADGVVPSAHRVRLVRAVPLCAATCVGVSPTGRRAAHGTAASSAREPAAGGGGGRCQATYPLRSVAKQLRCRLRATRLRSAAVVPRRAEGEDGRARHVRRELGRLDARAPGGLPPGPRGRAGRRPAPGRRGHRAPAPDGARRPAGDSAPWQAARAAVATSRTDSVGVARGVDTGPDPGQPAARIVTLGPGCPRASHGRRRGHVETCRCNASTRVAGAT